MLLENPFFVREIRAFGRRGFALVAWPLMVQAVFLTLPLLLMERATSGRLQPLDAWRGLALVLFGLGHAATCGGVGWIVGKRVFGEEHRRRALDGLRLLTTHPAVWLSQKLVFPFYLLGLVWAAGLPFYAVVALRAHFLPSQLVPGAQLALCLGLLTFGAALLAPAEGLRSPVRAGSRVKQAAVWSDTLLMGLPLWITLVLLRLALDWMYYALGQRPAPYANAPFFGTYLPTDRGLMLLLAAYTVACYGAAYPHAHPAGRWSLPLRNGSRLFSVTIAYVLFLGYSWRGRLDLPYVLLSLVGLLAAVMVALPAEWRERLTPERGRRPRNEDPRAIRDLARLGKLLDNAVFMRDLRVALRGSGLGRQFLLHGAGLFALSGAVGSMGLPFYGVAGRGSTLLPPFVSQLASGTLLIGSWLILPALLAYGGRAISNWGTERRCAMLPQIFATPLSAEAFVRGRWFAAVLVGLVRALPVPLGFLLALLVVAERAELPVYVAQGVWLTTLGLILSAGLAGSAQDTSIQLEDLFCSGCLAVYAVMVEGALFLWQWAQAPVGANGVADRSGLVVYAWSMVPLNLLLTYGVYRRAVADIAFLRRKESEYE